MAPLPTIGPLGSHRPVALAADGASLVALPREDVDRRGPFVSTAARPLLDAGKGVAVRIGDLLAAAGSLPAPDLVVAHVGRCGSTLLCNLLELDPAVMVARENPALNSWLSGVDRGVWSPEGFVQTTRALASWAGGYEAGVGVLKLSSWNLGHLPLLRRSLEGVPFVVMTANPERVVASYVRSPPEWAFAWFGLDGWAGTQWGRARSIAAGVGASIGGVIGQPELTTPVDLESLLADPVGVVRRVGALAGSPLLAAIDGAPVEAVLGSDAKNPGRPYQANLVALSRRSRLAIGVGVGAGAGG